MLELHTLLLAFVEGVGLILSPCILPILPIVLAAGVDGGRKRPYGIILGLVISFSLFSLLSRQLVIWAHIDSEWLQQGSYILLLIFGFILLSSKLSEKFGQATSNLGNLGDRFASQQSGGFFGGLLLGAIIGLVWVPCAGPILAAVIVQTITQKVTLNAFIILFVFSLGAGVPMLLITLFGRDLLARVPILKGNADMIRKVLGAVIIVTVIITSGWISRAFGTINPANVVVQQTGQSADLKGEGLIDGLSTSYDAPEITGIDDWINSPGVMLKSLRGKVVLIDFWTYSCINCVRTLPFLKDLYKKYHSKGLEIIGIHSPEFQFEHKLGNVKEAVAKHQIKYPVGLDNQFKTWLAFKNNYWPAHYLINAEGKVVYTHFGEGKYDVLENNIRYLLGLKPEKKKKVEAHTANVGEITPETYLGYARMSHFQSPQPEVRDQASTYAFSDGLNLNHWTLFGDWEFQGQRIIAKKAGASLKLKFLAKNVFLVMGTNTGEPIMARILIDGKAPGAKAGNALKKEHVAVSQDTLYELVKLPKRQEGVVEIIAQAPGLECYAFTFG